MRIVHAHRPLPEPVRNAWDRMRAWLGQSARRRWALAGLIVMAGLLITAGRFATSSAGGSEWLFDGKPLPSTEAARILSVLKGADIPCVESRGRIGVPAARRADAFDLLTKHKLGPRPIDDLLDEGANSGSIWDSPNQQERRDLRDKARFAEALLSYKVRGVIEAHVKLTLMPSENRLHPVRHIKATAFIETEGGQVLAPAALDMVRHILTSIDDVSPENLTVLDLTTNREYLVAGQPEVEAHATVRGREEELSAKILDELQIVGARVSVRLDPVSTVAPMEQASPLVNRPIGEVASALHASTEKPAGLLVNQAASTPSPRERATVLVRVPRSHFLRLFQEIHPHQNATPEDLAPLALRAGEQIRTVVHAIIPPDELVDLKIDRIDDVGPPRAVLSASQAGVRPISSWVAVAGGVALAAVVLGVVGGGWLAARRPPVRGLRASAAPAPADVAPGPIERVRELVRLDPAAAAGVVQRWIGEGGHVR